MTTLWAVTMHEVDVKYNLLLMRFSLLTIYRRALCDKTVNLEWSHIPVSEDFKLKYLSLFFNFDECIDFADARRNYFTAGLYIKKVQTPSLSKGEQIKKTSRVYNSYHSWSYCERLMSTFPNMYFEGIWTRKRSKKYQPMKTWQTLIDKDVTIVNVYGHRKVLTPNHVISGRIEGNASPAPLKEVLSYMNNDEEVGLVAREDPLIISLGNIWTEK